ncbi:MAG: protocatechuate 3,4-dioxygenase subunit beta, partial [Gemmatimonadota bacterium]|nr:protocatechuate 3,4-dioxygenase subunit beta [Gemmatimonadota bacterium]
ERIVVTGRVLDSTGRPLQGALLEIWQANAAGRYIHKKDQHDAPLDPNFTGTGRCLTDDDGRYSFTTIRPGAYPWLNHENAWRPSHIHFSIFGRSFSQRLVTQMYFPGDPLLAFDPIYNSIPGEAARRRLLARFDLSVTQPEWALGFGFDLVVGGARQTPFEDGSP